VIIDSQPLTVAVLASLLFGETIGALGVLGLATGVIGLLLLEVPTQVVGEIFKGHGLSIEDFSAISTSLNNWSIWDSGEWWMLLAAQSMAVGTVMVQWLCQFADPVMATGWDEAGEAEQSNSRMELMQAEKGKRIRLKVNRRWRTAEEGKLAKGKATCPNRELTQGVEGRWGNLRRKGKPRPGSREGGGGGGGGWLNLQKDGA
ncbi:hypothetical protein L7F22_018770, partial [Adiantum nelumboides]|nr:hypothetical protein [Adiantum nelumboides]